MPGGRTHWFRSWHGSATSPFSATTLLSREFSVRTQTLLARDQRRAAATTVHTIATVGWRDSCSRQLVLSPTNSWCRHAFDWDWKVKIWPGIKKKPYKVGKQCTDRRFNRMCVLRFRQFARRTHTLVSQRRRRFRPVSGRPFQTPIGPEVYKSYYSRCTVILGRCAAQVISSFVNFAVLDLRV